MTLVVRGRSSWQYPARIVPLAFLGAIAIGTVLMMLPASRAEPGHAPFVTALFTATSAVCVTGLAVVDTPTYWSTFGQVMLTVLSQVGGFGIMTLATLLSLLVSRRLGLRSRLMAQAESAGLFGGNVARVLVRIALTMFACEAAISVVLTLRFWLTYDYSFGRAVWEAVFHAVQAFNNAGFALYPDSLVRFVGDWWICMPLTLGCSPARSASRCSSSWPASGVSRLPGRRTPGSPCGARCCSARSASWCS
jgi:trk system potassium uptake protein